MYEEFKKVYSGKFILAPIQKEMGVGYSDFFFDSFWMKNNIKGYAERNLLKAAPEIKTEEIPVIVIIDDYSGSGKTFKRFHKKLMEQNPNLKTVKTFFLTLISSSIAIKNINNNNTLKNIPFLLGAKSSPSTKSLLENLYEPL